ncbi:MAG: cobalt-precorrin-5B (C(1))-methyltransferase [Rhodospirillales bacterium]
MSESREPRKPARKPEDALRRGWTTGACAAAAACAAAQALLDGAFPDPVTITLPGGQEPAFALSRAERRSETTAAAGVIKDAGDDPDVTHGAEIIAAVTLTDAGTEADAETGAGVTFKAGTGVGTVTRPGLPLPPGEPAINPGPRAMITSAVMGAVMNAAERTGRNIANISAEIEISIPGGEALAEKTMNGRLGIIGGLSVLGTTGIVIPYSCASWIHSIHRGVDVARAAGCAHIAAATGSVSEAAVQKILNLPDYALIDMGDFAGGLLKYLRRHPAGRLTIAGGFGKLAKLAQGAVDLHSARSRLDMAALAATARDAGADAETAEKIAAAVTGQGALDIALGAGVPLGDVVARRARETALATAGGGTDIDVIIFNREGVCTGQSNA